MTSLRRKMRDDLALRNLSPRTHDRYVDAVARFARFYACCPSKLGTREVRAFLLHLRELGRAPATCIVYWAALRFLYIETLGRPEVFATIPRPRKPRHSEPVPLTTEEVRALLGAATTPFDHAFFATMLETGLRISEAARLRVEHIDATAGLVRVVGGKGGKDRAVRLTDRLLHELREYWKVERPCRPFVFPAQRLVAPGVVASGGQRFQRRPVSTSTMSRRLREMVACAGLRRSVTSHDLRRTFASRLLASGVDTRVLQVLLGHASPKTTARYTGVDVDLIRTVPSILEQL